MCPIKFDPKELKFQWKRQITIRYIIIISRINISFAHGKLTKLSIILLLIFCYFYVSNEVYFITGSVGLLMAKQPVEEPPGMSVSQGLPLSSFY